MEAGRFSGKGESVLQPERQYPQLIVISDKQVGFTYGQREYAAHARPTYGNRRSLAVDDRRPRFVKYINGALIEIGDKDSRMRPAPAYSERGRGGHKPALLH